VLEFLVTFDRVFAVVEDNDGEKLRALGYGSGESGPATRRSISWSRSATPRRKSAISPPPTASAKNSRIVV